LPRRSRSKASEDRNEIIERLDKVILLLQDLFILEGVKMKMNKEGLRKILEIDKKRINRISKLARET